jgi:predicted transcriptional regulator
MSDTVSVKMKKTKKIDVRLDQALFDLVDNHAQASRLSRAQVVERALLHLFGQTVEDNPIKQGKAPAQPSQVGPIPQKKKHATG